MVSILRDDVDDGMHTLCQDPCHLCLLEGRVSIGVEGGRIELRRCVGEKSVATRTNHAPKRMRGYYLRPVMIAVVGGRSCCLKVV